MKTQIRTDKIEFNGKEYRLRKVDLDGDGSDYLIGPENLQEILLDDTGQLVSVEAQGVDEMIFYYVPESDLGLPENELAELINREINSYNK